MIKRVLPLAVLALALAALSCKHQVPASLPPGTGKLNFPCLRYDSGQLDYRLDSIQNRGLILQFFLADAQNNNSQFQLISYAFDTLGDHNNSWMPDTLRVDTGNPVQSFSGRVILGNTEVTREQLYDVLNKPDGHRVSYDYVLFTPVVEGVFHHLVYRIRPIKNGKPALGNDEKMQMTTPMPPSRVW